MSTCTTGTVQSEFAKRQLERMGWKEGNGLGKDRQGRAAPIIVKQRPDVTGGLGIEKEKVRQVQHTIQDEWWKDALGDTLSKLCDRKEKKKKKKRKRDTDSKNSDDCTSTETKRKKVFTDEELFIATGGARFGMRAGKTRNQAKWRRTGELETNMVLQQQQQQQHRIQHNNVDIVTESTTVSIAGVEDQTTPKFNRDDIETKTAQCENLPDKKNKSMRSQVRKEKKKRDEKIDPKLKTNQNEQKVVVTEHALVDSSNTDTTISTSPLLEENRKKKKKKKKEQLSIVV